MLFFRCTTYITLLYLILYNMNVVYNYLSHVIQDKIQIYYIYKYMNLISFV
jgi:hypothetical protein